MTLPTDFKFSTEPKDNRSPLIRFSATLKAWTPVTMQFEGRDKASQSIKFDFIDLTPIETTEPYPFPIASITVGYATSSETRWAAWAKSFTNLVPAVDRQKAASAPGGQEFDTLVGKRQEWGFKPARLRQPLKDEHGEEVLDASGRAKWGTQDADAWQIISIDGYGSASGGVNIMDVIVGYADGKGAQDILQYVVTDMGLKSLAGSQAAVEAAIGRTLLPTLVSQGLLTQDAEGVYHKS